MVYRPFLLENPAEVRFLSQLQPAYFSASQQLKLGIQRNSFPGAGKDFIKRIGDRRPVPLQVANFLAQLIQGHRYHLQRVQDQFYFFNGEDRIDPRRF